MEKHTQASIITIPGDFSYNDISRYMFWLCSRHKCMQWIVEEDFIVLTAEHLNYCPRLHSEIYPGPRHPHPDVTSKHSSLRTQDWGGPWASIDSLIRLTLFEMLVLGSKLSHDKSWIYNSDQILWWVMETSSVLMFSLKNFFSSGNWSWSVGATCSLSLCGDTQAAAQLESRTRVFTPVFSTFPQCLAQYVCW